jgi:hypothetical protein
MHQNLLNGEFVSLVYQNAGNKNLCVLWVMKALTKVYTRAFAAHMPASLFLSYLIHTFCQIMTGHGV